MADRLQAMELLWRSISTDSDVLKSPAWHKRVFTKRLAKIESGKGEFLTISRLERRLAKRRA